MKPDASAWGPTQRGVCGISTPSRSTRSSGRRSRLRNRRTHGNGPWLARASASMVADGFDFNDDRDGLWVEGTAQAALTLPSLRQPRGSARLLDSIANEISPSGWLYATRRESPASAPGCGRTLEYDGPTFSISVVPTLALRPGAILAAMGATLHCRITGSEVVMFPSSPATCIRYWRSTCRSSSLSWRSADLLDPEKLFDRHSFGGLRPECCS